MAACAGGGRGRWGAAARDRGADGCGGGVEAVGAPPIEDAGDDPAGSQMLAADTFAAQFAASAAYTCKLFFFGQGIGRAELEDQLRALAVPVHFVPVADLANEFGAAAAAAWTTGKAATTGGGEEERTASFDIQLAGADGKAVSEGVTLRLCGAAAAQQLHATALRGSVALPVTTVGTTVFVDLRGLEREHALRLLERWYLAGVAVSRQELRAVLSKVTGSVDPAAFTSAWQQRVFDRVVRHPVTERHPVRPDRRAGLCTDLFRTALAGGGDVCDALAEAATAEGAASAQRHAQQPGTQFYYRTFLLRGKHLPPAGVPASVRCRDNFGGTVGTSIKVWSAGVVLGEFLARRGEEGNDGALCGKAVVEFGCGTGACGVCCLVGLLAQQDDGGGRRLPASYTFTDGTPAAVQNAQHNVAANGLVAAAAAAGCAVECAVLDWVDREAWMMQRREEVASAAAAAAAAAVTTAAETVIVAADVFYDPAVTQAFVEYVAGPMLLRDPPAAADCIVALQERDARSYREALQHVRSRGLAHELLAEAACPFDSPAPVRVFRLSRAAAAGEGGGEAPPPCPYGSSAASRGQVGT